MPLNVFEFFPVIDYKRNYSLSAISTFFLSFNFYQKNAVKCSQPLFINLQYSSKVDGQRTCKTFAVFRVLRKKKGVLKRASWGSFSYYYSTQSACFVLHCFGKLRFSVWKCCHRSIKSTCTYLNIKRTQRLPFARAAVRKGRARLREQGAWKVAVPSMRPSHKTVEWEVAKPQVWVICHSCSRNSTPQNFMKLKFMKFLCLLHL